MGILFVVTGPMGAGKTTFALKNRGEFGAVYHTDTGKLGDDGKYYLPEDAPEVFRKRIDEVMEQVRSGKYVCLDAYPSALVRRKDLIAQIDLLLILEAPVEVRRKRIKKRGSERGSCARFDAQSFERYEKTWEQALEDVKSMLSPEAVVVRMDTI